MATQWPLIAERLLGLLPTLSGWTDVQVFDGPPVTGDIPADYATVGYVSDSQAGTYSLMQDDDGFQWGETGTIRSQLTCVTGDEDGLADCRTRAFALMDSVETYVRSDRTLGGVISPAGTSQLDVEVVSMQSGNGSGQTVVFTLTYYTVT